ncbi:hypothetical protein GCM10017044_28880 [Kordiimonas sediminis]|uniref:TIR domain-containing protein n=1 Tax=Kordiimonas sediminis TaxID=1735581 RepID=A0A919EBM3_9PROT|nr:toll/interleukin-1 receptor domain-containing protein [Kordiimonas sediminis]GHF32103.1 hypothetical protein GCM10017044_28880 [Kordiimonas sediminis]
MKCFLSHSSLDKNHYVSKVAEKLSPNIEYDEMTFEEGKGNFEEIINALNRSDIFVLFLSENSLSSEWVAREISEAKLRLENGALKRIFPIVIDRAITYQDERIPEWIRENYNLRPITKPTLAAKRIKERMIEASWNSHPMLKKRDQIFVGRNKYIDDFEQRIDDFSKAPPLVVFTSGLREIGRKSLLRRALAKANVTRETYEPIRIDLNRDDNIEGFILKLSDLNLSDDIDTSNLLSRTTADKETLCAKLIDDIICSHEILLIDDHYCIVRYDRDIAPWFMNTIEKVEHKQIGLCVATSAKAAKYKYIRDDRLYFIELPELQQAERAGLFKRYCQYLDVELTNQVYENFIPLLKGFPEQVTYAATLIKELGVRGAFQRSHEIVSFSTYKASIFLRQYEDEEPVLAFLRFLASFEFVSLDFTQQIAEEINLPLTDYIDRFVADSVCEPIGGSGQYFRINEVIRDAVVRDRTHMTSEYHSALHKFVKHFARNYSTEEFDVSEYHIAVKQALVMHVNLPESMMIPAHFLQSMRDLYFEKSYKEVVQLADRVMQNSNYYDEHTRQDILYYLCQSLARLKDPRFTSEVQKISGPEHDFLFGFYYRQKRRYDDALVRYRRAMNHVRTEQRARREVVFILVSIEDYEQGLSLAEENYLRYPSNPFIAQAYFQCLLYAPGQEQKQEKLHKILESLEKVGGARGKEIHSSLAAIYEHKFGDKQQAYRNIDEAIREYSDVAYPVLTKLDMAVQDMNRNLISESLSMLSNAGATSGHTTIKAKAQALLAAFDGDQGEANRIVENELSDLSSNAKERLIRRIRSII